MMLVHLGDTEVATLVHNAWLRTIEDGVHTGDIHSPDASTRRVGTRAFSEAVIERLGEAPRSLRPAAYGAMPPVVVPAAPQRRATAQKELVGVDIFVNFREPQANALADTLRPLAGPEFTLEMITNRGVKVWPDGYPETFCTDHWRCRFRAGVYASTVSPESILRLWSRLLNGRIEIIKMEHLYLFDGAPGFSLGQGQ